ncbi:MAG TPA: RnfABCDGE type electron transport complex subunit D [Acetivibrio clariflavus]|nr:RnfABCDGE type electron transport complex subunit D [Acetivibrio clariflavus]
MENRLIVSSSPHFRANTNTQRIMLDVIIALLPATVAGIYFFGSRAALVIFVTILSCVISEYLSRKALKKESTITDLSAVVTGLLLALNLPSTIPLWMAAIGGVVAIVIAKQLFGGLGQNFMNPALVARVFLLNAFLKQMTSFEKPIGVDVISSATSVDAISSATPLYQMKEFVKGNAAYLPEYWDLFIGKIAGCIGETSVIALLIGAAYLLYRRVISPEIPVTFIGSVALLTWIFGGKTLFTGDWLYHVLSGGLMIGAFFMATDYATSPVTFKGRVIMGLGCGILTAVIRLYTGYPEGVSYAILLMNICVPLIDRYTVPKSFGGEKAVA